MNTRDLEYLIAVAEELHFGRAAERCHASQPALSGQVQKLEERLGVTLFERSKRHVRLTEIGARIVGHARDVLASVDALEQTANAHKSPFAGQCTIGMPPTICPFLTPLLLPAMQHYLPDISLDLVEDFTDALEQQLIDGKLDMAVLATAPTHKGLSDITLYEEPFWVALPNSHALTQQDTIDIAQIDPGELLLLSDGHCLRDQVYEICQLNRPENTPGGSPRPNQAPRTQKTSLSTILSLVGAGYGLTLVPAMSLSDAWITDAGIAVRREHSGTAGRTIRLTHRTHYPRHALVEKIADIIAGIVPNTVSPVRR